MATLSEVQIANKLKTKDAAFRLKHGSPKVQQIIRTRCKIRLMKMRQKSFDSGRNLTCEELKDTLNDILIDELAQLEMDLKTEDEILQELSLLDNTKVQDRDLDDFFEHLEIDMSDLVTCPCCLKNAIGNDSEGLIICKCGLRLRKGNIKDLESEIWMNVNMHSANCSRTPQFISMPNDAADVLIIGCPDCKFSKVVY